LEDRLKAKGKSEERDLQGLRRRVAFDRLLHRIFIAESGLVLLKGGYAMELRLPIARTTKDVDLSILKKELFTVTKEEQEDSLFDLLNSAARIDLKDYFEFEVTRTQNQIDAIYGGSRFSVSSIISGKTFVSFHVDLAIGDALIEPSETTKPEQFLSFANIITPDYPIIPREQHFAEKLHIYTRTDLYDNSRVKDLIDMVLLIKNGMDMDKLVKAVEKTFQHRRTHNVPKILKEPNENWKNPYLKMAQQCRITMDIEEAFNYINGFFMDHIAGKTTSFKESSKPRQ
jgi:hypothetical protein